MALQINKIKSIGLFINFLKVYACARGANAEKIIHPYTEPTPNEFKLRLSHRGMNFS